MAHVTLETDTETKPHTVNDPRGRVIAVRKINALDRLKLFECVGADNSKNEAYLGYATLAWHVAGIDGQAVSRPGSKAQLEVLVSRLDEDGLGSVAGAIPALYGTGDEAEALLKNASGTPAS